MFLIVGLGNPGKRYRDTPHNAGFQVCDRLADRYGLGDEVQKHQGLFWRGRLLNQDVGILKPQTFMNLSGESVGEAMRYLPVQPEDMILVYDDMDIPSGTLRLRKKGGHGGHNGIRSVIEHLGSKDFARLRVGVGRPGREGATGHLLSKVRSEEREVFAKTVDLAADAVEAFIKDGIEAAMNRYNGLVANDEEQEGTK
ncbi:MAG: aminoacyl-tRNA hydrolase [bacterium]|nr:aminoacyl-tRNA hydrolase [bacterium]